MTINADSSVQILAEEAVPVERLDLQVEHFAHLILLDCLLGSVEGLIRVDGCQ